MKFAFPRNLTQVLRMAFGSQRRSRGWWIAILLAVGIAGIFGYLEKTAFEDWLNSRDDIPSRMVEASVPKASGDIATSGLTRSFEADYPAIRNDWLDYRSRPVVSAFELVEPRAGVRLLAPRAIDSTSEAFAIDSDRAPAGIERQNEFHSTARLASSSRNLVNLSPEMGLTSRMPLRSADRLSPDGSPAWPFAKHLVAELASLRKASSGRSDAATVTWCELIETQLEEFRRSELDSVSTKIERLKEIAMATIEDVSSRGASSDCDSDRLRIAHGLIRRAMVWGSVAACLGQRETTSRKREFEVDRLAEALSQVEAAITATNDGEGWRTYLMLDDLVGIVRAESESVALASEVAQVVLSRVMSINVTETQQKFLDTVEVHHLAECLQPLAIAPVDYARLLLDLEAVEENSEHRGRNTLIDVIQALRFSDDPLQAAVSRTIETYYRNSNVRVALTQDFANRFAPAKQILQRPVRQTVLGADTRGNSQVDTKLSLRFIPDPHAWNIELDLVGKIHSQTRSARGPAVFFNSSNSQVSATRRIHIDTHGLRVQDDGQARVSSNESLRGVETTYDGLPFIGEMVKYMASQEFKEQRGPARRIMQRTIANQTDTEFDKHLDGKIKQAQDGMETRFLGPLRNLNLNPMVTDLQTTQDRLIARYRIAGDNALAANTPRPQAPSDSQLSIQLHQSAINNGFSRLGLSDRESTLLELAQSLAEQLGQEPITELPPEVPKDVRVRFEGDRPVVVEFVDGRLWLTLNVAILTQPGRIELTDFVIRTSYVPAVTGLRAELIRDGAISVDGDQISARERLPLRLIFGKIFAARSNIPLIQESVANDERMQGLAISQIVLERGWLAIALSENVSPHVALLQSMQTTR
jgi:hypothetical protein